MRVFLPPPFGALDNPPKKNKRKKHFLLPHLAASDSPSPRDEHSASISSMKTIEGALSLAIVKSWLTSFSDSPSHLLTKSELEIEKKVEAASVATAFAK